MSDRLLIFDFDGVIADSEVISNEVLADELTALGMATSVDDALHLYMGKRWADCFAAIETNWHRQLPADFRDRCDAAVRFRSTFEIQPVPGVVGFLDGLGSRPRCVASSSPPDWLQFNLNRFGLSHHFGDRLFSAAVHVERGKPHPDLFFHAAAQMAADPARAIVIEDSATGVMAGVAAGMTVIGLCAGSHIRPGHADKLLDAGADHIIDSYPSLDRLLGDLG